MRDAPCGSFHITVSNLKTQSKRPGLPLKTMAKHLKRMFLTFANKINCLCSSQINPDNEPDADLMQRIVRATPRPKYLRDIAHDFVTKFMEGGTGMAAIHWRYNHGDWLRHCEHHPSPACTAVLE